MGKRSLGAHPSVAARPERGVGVTNRSVVAPERKLRTGQNDRPPLLVDHELDGASAAVESSPDPDRDGDAPYSSKDVPEPGLASIEAGDEEVCHGATRPPPPEAPL